ncbi:hypothetical protein BIY26_20740 [Brenneria goodwinii]|uniref:Oxalate/formate antiporter n=2 Tax=Brenneria goodwinii TaxID=1109412 RepID=A0A0G4K2K4_9GAMM|nr:MFS transporter [Brenneria goodwinii]ATA24589.1 hypothetical protein AWC36_10955 [Brenneria goodwinii]MCG8163508.1 MFS transporter [Brenneria goodwinii]MCG8172863.1 MFS transporter [Brenneria goodwinii]MCG8187918.1 MFS transporter [Brenneria goodwinii]MCG8200786.1 MFS transporter [Brenneria goodwinii]
MCNYINQSIHRMKNKWLLPASVVLVLVCGLLYSWSIYVIPLEREFGWNRSQTAFNFTVCISFFTLGMFLAGLLVNKIGRRNTIWLGGIIASSGFWLASYSASLPWLYVSYGACGGLGIGLMYIVPLATCTSAYPERSGTIAGLITMCFGLGNLLLGFFVIAWLLEHYDWAVALRTVAAVILLASLSTGSFIRPGVSASVKGGPAADDWGFTMKGMVSTSSFWIYTAWIVPCESAGLMVIAHIVPFAIEAGIVTALAALAMGIEATSNSLGRLIFGYLIDRVGRRVTMMLTPVTMIIGLLTLWWGTPAFGFTALLIGCVIVGISYGSIYAQNVSLILQFFGPKHYTSNLGLQGFSMFFGALAGPQIAGFIQSTTGSYTPGFITAIVIVFIGMIFGLFVKPPKNQREIIKRNNDFVGCGTD